MTKQEFIKECGKTFAAGVVVTAVLLGMIYIVGFTLIGAQALPVIIWKVAGIVLAVCVFVMSLGAVARSAIKDWRDEKERKKLIKQGRQYPLQKIDFKDNITYGHEGGSKDDEV